MVRESIEQKGEQKALEHLWEEVKATLPEGKVMVPGEGVIGARLVIVGEAPGEREESERRPFVGRAGALLDAMLTETGIPRQEAWVTNVVKWRPTSQQDGRLLNRPPSTKEAEVGDRLLRQELAIIKPRLILALGNSAAQALIDPKFKMNQGHGRWHKGPEGARVMATFHPAYILRRVGADREQLMAAYRTDFAEIAKALRELDGKEE
jgi:DNA polymerase